MTKTELESKHLSELHSLAAAAGIPRYRMLPRAELIAALAGEEGESAATESGAGRSEGEGAQSRPRRRRRRSGTSGQGRDGEGGGAERAGKPAERSAERSSEKPRRQRRRREREAAKDTEKPEEKPATPIVPPTPVDVDVPRPKRRRRRFGRRRNRGVTLPDLLLPPQAGRQTVLCAENREACTALLRGVAAELAAAGKGPDPVALLIDPSPEELAHWKREAPRAELVAAGQAHHAGDALAAAASRAAAGEDVILLIDSLNRLAEAYEDSAAAKEFFDAGRVETGSGSLTVVAALERS